MILIKKSTEKFKPNWENDIEWLEWLKLCKRFEESKTKEKIEDEHQKRNICKRLE